MAKCFQWGKMKQKKNRGVILLFFRSGHPWIAVNHKTAGWVPSSLSFHSTPAFSAISRSRILLSLLAARATPVRMRKVEYFGHWNQFMCCFRMLLFLNQRCYKSRHVQTSTIGPRATRTRNIWHIDMTRYFNKWTCELTSINYWSPYMHVKTWSAEKCPIKLQLG